MAPAYQSIDVPAETPAAPAPVNRTRQLVCAVAFVAALAAVPLAVLGVLPNACLADVAVNHGLRTGQKVEGMYFAARTLFFTVLLLQPAIARAIDPVPSNPSRTHRHVGANGAMARQSASMDARV